MLKIILPIFERILKITYPNYNKLIGEIVQQKLDDQKEEFWIALKSINAEVGEEFEGGILNNVITPEAISKKIKKLYRKWKIQKIKLKKIANALQVEIPEVVQETERTVDENEELSEIIDAINPAVRSAARAIKKIDKIKKSKEIERK